MFINFFSGILIGLITGMPLGPIGAICLKNTIKFGRKYGLISGFGSAVTDSIYAGLAALGFIFIERFILIHQFYLKVLGGSILIIFGFFTFLSEKKCEASYTVEDETDTENITCSISPSKAFSSTFLIAIANPATIFSFIVVFTGLHMAKMQDTIMDKLIMVIGVFTGSMLWWLILITAAGKFADKLDKKNASIISRCLSSLIVFSGIFIFLGAFNIFSMRRSSILHPQLFEIFFNIKNKIPFHLK